MKKLKIPKFGTKNALFGYFGAGISKNYCHISNQLPRICRSCCKILRKNKNSQALGIFDPKCLFEIFLGKNFKKTIVIFEISTLKFVKNESLTHTVNFSIGLAFSKDSGSTFSDSLRRVPGLPYRVCRFTKR